MHVLARRFSLLNSGNGFFGPRLVSAGENKGFWLKFGHLLGCFEPDTGVGSSDDDNLASQISSIFILSTIEITIGPCQKSYHYPSDCQNFVCEECSQ